MTEITDIYIKIKKTMEQAIKHDNANSVLIKVNDTLSVWFDLWIDNDNELTGDWNKYIFYLNDKNDLEIQDYQSNAENFTTCFELAEEYLKEKNILIENSNGEYSFA